MTTFEEMTEPMRLLGLAADLEALAYSGSDDLGVHRLALVTAAKVLRDIDATGYVHKVQKEE